MTYVVDSDLVIDGLKGIRSALDLLEPLRGDGVAVSVVTLAEIAEGAFGTDDPRRISRPCDASSRGMPGST